jgi:His/Glu/Gln/Arg/opine family amino acid ABC transporter permease subunit
VPAPRRGPSLCARVERTWWDAGLYEINFGALAPYIGPFLGGLVQTLALSGATLAIALPLGLGGALLRTSQHKVLRRLVAGYVQAVRNVPLLLILFIVFFELPQVGLRFSPFVAGVVGLSINITAYVIEIFRGGLAAIPKGQYEAANSLALRPHQVFVYVVLPQLARISYPALGNQVVGTTLATSQCFFIGVAELTSVTNVVGSETFRYFEVFAVAGLLYIIAAHTINQVWIRAGRHWKIIGTQAHRA